MIIAIRQWEETVITSSFHSMDFKVENTPFYAIFFFYLPDIRIYQGDRLVTVIPNKSTDTDVADKLIVDAFQNNPALRYLVERNGKK